ncbi:hypothetical protein [Bradyrhizobium japonicum]|uniref:hypothetical protein n=1 Tax=Bradyrhizobium japonicum TaxID=375 RepID=UPI001BACC7AE|nr:hypothetical protein [Bradyrhizobium japonicum]MBR0914914.1 hypothetical protein [Bradyrhizobium japonicum]
MKFQIEYQFYNGSAGTHGGEQIIYFQFFDSQMRRLTRLDWTHGTERGQCSYGFPYWGGMQFPENARINQFDQIAYVRMWIGTVSGNQGPC